MLAVYFFGGLAIVFSTVMYASRYSKTKLRKHLKNIPLQLNSIKCRAQEIRTHKDRQFFNTSIVLIACIAFACTVLSVIIFQLHA